MVVHHAVTAGWRDEIQPSAVMQCRIDRVFEQWTNEMHFAIATTGSSL